MPLRQSRACPLTRGLRQREPRAASLATSAWRCGERARRTRSALQQQAPLAAQFSDGACDGRSDARARARSTGRIIRARACGFACAAARPRPSARRLKSHWYEVHATYTHDVRAPRLRRAEHLLGCAAHRLLVGLPQG